MHTQDRERWGGKRLEMMLSKGTEGKRLGMEVSLYCVHTYR